MKFLNTHLKQMGFSLVEVVVATLIFALAAAGIMATVAALSNPSRSVRSDVQAAFLAREVIEDLRGQVTATEWTNASGPFVQGADYGAAYPDVTDTAGGVTYSREYTITDDPDTGGKFVDVTVTW